MKTSPVTLADLAASVLAVPPLARDTDLELDWDENSKLVRHIESGGVLTLLYGGNANLYHVRLSEYAKLLEMISTIAEENTLVIPSAGPAFGMMMDQAKVIGQFNFPTVMVLPQQGLTTPDGVAFGIRKFAEKVQRPVILYVKHEGFVTVDVVRRLADDGLLSGIKYAIVREDPTEDDFLRELVGQVDPRLVISGIGEQPAIVHLRDFGLGGFTSGCVCVAPRMSTDMLRAIDAEDYEAAERIRGQFKPLEDLRNEINPIRVLHEAVRLCGIADTGPLLPLLSNLESQLWSGVQSAATVLLKLNNEQTLPA